MEKSSYPNYDSYRSVEKPYNKDKWLATIKDIFFLEHNGLSRPEAVAKACYNWQEPEKINFLSYLSYYESGSHLKYKESSMKFAQYKSVYDGGAGYFLHVKDDQNNLNSAISGDNISSLREEISSELTHAEKKEIVEKQKKAIIGRLNSIEKILVSPNGQLFAGPEFEFLIQTIQGLKLKILKINKISSSTRIYSDMIAKEANVSVIKGFVKAASILNKLADEIPQATSSNPPTQLSGAPDMSGQSKGPGTSGTGQPADNGGNNATIDPASEPIPENTVDKNKDKSKGIKDFLANMGEINESDDGLVVEAQALPEQQMSPEKQDTPPAEDISIDEPTAKAPESLEVEEASKESAQDIDAHTVSDVDNRFEKALDGITVSDVIAKLESITNIFRTREVPRALAIVDIMLHNLGLASLTPTLAEANSKSLESNNYVLSRLEDLISKLRGAVATENIGLSSNTEKLPKTPEVEKVKQKLQSDQDKERARKEKRKNQENEELEVEEELPTEELPATLPEAVNKEPPVENLEV